MKILKSKINVNLDYEVKVTDNYCATPLIAACKRGHKELAEILIKHKGYVNQVTSLGEHALNVAVYGEHKDIVQLLLDNFINPNVEIQEKPSPLMAACSLWNKVVARAIVEMLIEKGAMINADILGQSPLFAACNKGDEIIVEMLIKKGAMINVVDI